MHKIFYSFFIFAVALCTSCNHQNVPNVDDVPVSLSVERFEKDFFALDTVHMDSSMNRIKSNYPDFLPLYTDKILGLESVEYAQRVMAIKKFKHDYQSIYDSTVLLQKELDASVGKIKKSFQYIKYYFPKYLLPKKFITFIGPIDAFAYGETGGSGDIITSDGLCIGLQLHLGSNSITYKSEIGQQLYPEYISRKFTTEYIAVNCIKNIIDDIFPPTNDRKSLIDFLVDHGKRMYLLDMFMPYEKEEIKMGYTPNQLKGVYANEGYMWNYFTENNLLYENDYIKIRSFVADGPITSEFGLGSPGFISLFIGKQLVKAYMNQHTETSLEELLELNPKQLLNGSKYRPK